MRQNLLSKMYTSIVGGWRTWGPGTDKMPAGFASNVEGLESVNAHKAMQLSAYFACQKLRSETMGELPFKLIEKKTKKEITDHAVYDLIRNKPNSFQTGPEFISSMVANFDAFGNAIALISRYENGEPYNIDFIPTDQMTVTLDTLNRPKFVFNGEEWAPENVLHVPNFSLRGYWGIPTWIAAQMTLGSQMASNKAAAGLFRSGLRVGGFFIPDEKKGAIAPEIESDFYEKLAPFYRPENTGRWVLLPRGIKPEPQVLKIDPVSAELLNSRYFGIEEICRFYNVPPPLIGQTNKASSWAASLESLNQHLVTYSLQPTATRMERRIEMTLLNQRERNRFKVEFNMEGLLRGDIEKRFKSYEIGRKYNIYSPNDVRAIEGLPAREDEAGNEYTVQQNIQVNKNGDQDQEAKPTP